MNPGTASDRVSEGRSGLAISAIRSGIEPADHRVTTTGAIELSNELLRMISDVLDVRDVFPRVAQTASRLLRHDCLDSLRVSRRYSRDEASSAWPEIWTMSRHRTVDLISARSPVDLRQQVTNRSCVFARRLGNASSRLDSSRSDAQRTQSMTCRSRV
jgi:hypothetical protein